MKQLFFFITMFLLAVSGCKKDDSGPGDGGGGGTTTPFEFVTGRSWTYNGQFYETNGSPIANSTFQTSMTVQTTGQTIGGIANATVVRMVNRRGTHTDSYNLTAAYNQDKFMIYNGTSSSPNASPSLPGWSVLFDFKKDASSRSLLSFDSTYQLAMRSGRILRERVRYNATMRYIGDEAVSAFNTSNIPCSKYQFAFTYDAVVDTGGIVLFNGNVINITTTIWFSPSIGFVKIRGDDTQLFLGGDLANLTIRHGPGHISLAVHYYVYFGYDIFELVAGNGTQSGYSIFDGFSKNF